MHFEHKGKTTEKFKIAEPLQRDNSEIVDAEVVLRSVFQFSVKIMLKLDSATSKTSITSFGGLKFLKKYSAEGSSITRILYVNPEDSSITRILCVNPEDSSITRPTRG